MTQIKRTGEQTEVEAALLVAARRAHAWSEKHGFITPGDISNEEYIATQRDALLAKMGGCLVEWMSVTQSIAKEHPRIVHQQLGHLIDSIAHVRDTMQGQPTSDWLDNPATITHKQAMYSKLALMAEELGEVVECISYDAWDSACKEFADVEVRWLDTAGAMLIDTGTDMAAIVSEVMEKNERRPIRNGKKKFT